MPEPLRSTLAGFSLGMALIVAIGAQNAFVLRQGIRREYVLPVVLVCAGSDALLIAAGIAGLGAGLADRPSALTVVRWAGAAFLLGYAVLAVRRALRPGTLTPGQQVPGALRAALLTCLAFTYLNPHVYLDTVILLGSIARQYDRHWWFGAGAATASLLWFSGLGVGARRLAPLLARPNAWRWLDGVVAVTMVTIAASMLFG